MKTTILIKENRTQLVLHPESKHDKHVLDILQELPNTHRADLCDRQGGYTMFDRPRETYGDRGKDLMIVFDAPSEEGKSNE
jgi:hypothetical protein